MVRHGLFFGAVSMDRGWRDLPPLFFARMRLYCCRPRPDLLFELDPWRADAAWWPVFCLEHAPPSYS